tara:strand:- start:377 stop:1162 length:786 start_codon:yes stop_codon:yes gene_type:complete
MTALYTYVLKLQILQGLAYRFEFLSSLGTNTFFLFGTVFLWKSAYRGIGGVVEEQMITYAIVSVLMRALFQISVDSTSLGKIREGQIAIDFIRPVPLPLFWLTEDLGRSLTATTKFCLPVLVVAIALLKVPAPATLTAGLIFIPSCLLSYLMLWQILCPRRIHRFLGPRIRKHRPNQRRLHPDPVRIPDSPVAVSRLRAKRLTLSPLPVYLPDPTGDLHRPDRSLSRAVYPRHSSANDHYRVKSNDREYVFRVYLNGKYYI